MLVHRAWFILILVIAYVLQVSCVPASPQTTVEPDEVGLRWEDDLAINPPPPQNLQAVVVEEGVQLNWEPPLPVTVPHSYSDVIVHYRVFRRCTEDTSSTPLGTTQILTFIDTSPPLGQVFYLVTAVHVGETESSRSSEVIVMIGDADDTLVEPETLPLPTPDNSIPTAQTTVTPEATDKLAELHLIGGFAGFCDHLIIYMDGNASVLNECSGEQTNFQIESETFNQLTTMAVKFGLFSYSNEDNPGGADNLVTELILYGQGPAANQPNQEQQEEILRLVTSILVQGKL